MLAYVFWHRPATARGAEDYERALARFHHSLAENPPAGFTASVTLRARELPWLAPTGGEPAIGYEDWYLVENWTALGVLEAAAVSRGHAGAHDGAARGMGEGTGAVYRLLEGTPALSDMHTAVWVSRPPGSEEAQLADLLEDGFDPARTALFQRCLVLGPAPELCLLNAEELPGAGAAETGLAAGRLPPGWRALPAAREPLIA
jgi:hypothetical protein